LARRFDELRNQLFTIRINSTSNALIPNATWTNPFPVSAISTNIPTWVWGDPQPWTLQRTFNIQRALTNSTTLEVGYEGSAAINLQRTIYYNDSPPAPTVNNRNLLRPWPEFAFVQSVKAARRQTQLLELSVLMAAGEHYRRAGYAVQIRSPGKRRIFKVKTSTRGHPANFSRLEISRGGEGFEIHMNLLVQSAHDEGIYCVDTAVAHANRIPKKKGRKGEWRCLQNADLITFAEAKKLRVYPMLLAQFLGIVHEIRPEFLNLPTVSTDFFNGGHFAPALVSLGAYSGNSQRIVDAYSRRMILVNIEPNFDIRIAQLRSDLFSFGSTGKEHDPAGSPSSAVPAAAGK
jgi:hypothetical protein